MKKKEKQNRRGVLRLVSAIAILVIAVSAIVISVALTRPSDSFECEKAVLYEADGTTRAKVSRLKDPYASGGAVAGYTGGKVFEFRNSAQGNCVHIAYASDFTDQIRISVRRPGEERFSEACRVPFDASGDWTMDHAAEAVSALFDIPKGSVIRLQPHTDCNLDRIWITTETEDAAHQPAVSEADFAYSDENGPVLPIADNGRRLPQIRIQDTAAFAEAQAKAQALLPEMTLTEKIGQLSQFGSSIYTSDDAANQAGAVQGRAGSFLTIRGAEKTNRVQKDLLNATRLKIPALFADDVIHGYRTVFPTPLAQSCLWNPEAVRSSCEVAAKEAYSGGIRWTFSPMVDIARDPRWGRIMEGYGEDTYLCSQFAAAAVRGYQGDDAVPGENRLLACMKHYVAYGAGVGGRDYGEADLSYQTLFDVYTPPFEAGINAGAATVMPAFESLNGIPMSANEYLLTDVLRGRFGFGGVTVSDYNAVAELVAHAVAADESEAAEKGFNAGIDILMSGDLYNDALPKLIEEGKVDLKDVDEAVLRVLTLKYLCGLMDEPYTDETAESCLGCAEHRAVARKVAAECPVLLENDGTLPLKNAGSIALTGPYASGDGVYELRGNWVFMGRDTETVTIEAGFRNAFPDAEIDVIDGCGFDGAGDDLDGAVRSAAGYDVIVACVGERAGASGEAASVSSLSLPGNQEEYVRRLCDTGKPVVLVVCAGRPLIMTGLKDRVAALLYAWQLGTESGSVIADLIAGRVNPSGRLTVSFPVSEGQLPVYYNHLPTGRPGSADRFTSKYIDCQIAPLYPFGYGKSYSEFEFSDIRLSDTRIKADGRITVSLTVKNTGAYDGSTVVQLYTRDLVASRSRPVKELKGFQKVWLKAGESKTVSVTLEAAALAFADGETNMVVEPGDFMLWVAENSADDRYAFEFTVEP